MYRKILDFVIFISLFLYEQNQADGDPGIPAQQNLNRGPVTVTQPAEFGQDNRNGVPLADPFVYQRSDGTVELYGTGYDRINYPNISDFLQNINGKREAMKIFYGDIRDGRVSPGEQLY